MNEANDPKRLLAAIGRAVARERADRIFVERLPIPFHVAARYARAEWWRGFCGGALVILALFVLLVLMRWV